MCADTTEVSCWYAVVNVWVPKLSLAMGFICVVLGIAVCREDGELYGRKMARGMTEKVSLWL